jgi:Cupin domain
MTKLRVVETGLDQRGRSTVAADRLVDARELPTGRVLHSLWSDDRVLPAASDDAEPGLFPGPGGARFWLFTVRAGEPADADHGLHATQTVDLGYVVAGVVTMELEDGTQIDLQAGDAYVQNGTAHGWRNRGAADATIALVVLGTG